MLSEIWLRSLWVETSHHHWYCSSPPADWLTAWLTAWLTDCPTAWLTDWLIDWLTGWLIDWITSNWWRVTCVCRKSTPTSSCREFPRTCSTARPVRPSRAGCRYSLRRWRHQASALVVQFVSYINVVTKRCLTVFYPLCFLLFKYGNVW